MKISNLKKLRQIKGVSQMQCAADTDIPVRTIKRYEQGSNVGDIEYLSRLAKYFDVTIEELIEE